MRRWNFNFWTSTEKPEVKLLPVKRASYLTPRNRFMSASITLRMYIFCINLYLYQVPCHWLLCLWFRQEINNFAFDLSRCKCKCFCLHFNTNVFTFIKNSNCKHKYNISFAFVPRSRPVWESNPLSNGTSGLQRRTLLLNHKPCSVTYESV